MNWSNVILISYYQVTIRELEELLKETGTLTVPEASRWKWETIRILLRVCTFIHIFFSFFPPRIQVFLLKLSAKYE